MEVSLDEAIHAHARVVNYWYGDRAHTRRAQRRLNTRILCAITATLVIIAEK